MNLLPIILVKKDKNIFNSPLHYTTSDSSYSHTLTYPVIQNGGVDDILYATRHISIIEHHAGNPFPLTTLSVYCWNIKFSGQKVEFREYKQKISIYWLKMSIGKRWLLTRWILLKQYMSLTKAWEVGEGEWNVRSRVRKCIRR